MNDPLHEIAERRIQEAMEAGLFRGLPDEGRPLELRDLRQRRNSAALRYSILMERRGYDTVHAEYAARIARRSSD